MLKSSLALAAIIAIALLATVISGCSGAVKSDPVAPDPVVTERDTSHLLWGLYRFEADPVAKTLDVIPLRKADMHLNALVFLEPPPMILLSLDYLEINGNQIIADIGLRHPFLGLTEFTGFDVCGILISNGSVSGFSDSALLLAGAGDTHLTNPDSLSRWWNPDEFPPSGMLGYVDGLLGAPDSFANFNCTLNGSKYYTDNLDPTVDYLTVDPASRGIFSAGQKNVRRFEIELGDAGFVFNYAVDASWEFPQGDPPYQAPDDFGEGANRAEAWGARITEVMNKLYNDGTGSQGGSLSLSIDIYDHFNADQNIVKVESPGNFAAVSSPTPSGGGPGYSTYTVDITNATPAEGSIDLLVTVESEIMGFGDKLPSTPLSAYFSHTATVSSSLPVDPVTGNVTLETTRDGSQIITGLQISWTSSGAVEYAVYADIDPYNGLDTFTELVGTTSGTMLNINSSGWATFDTNAAYAFTVRARGVVGDPNTESGDSEYCFCDLDDFTDGTASGGGTWISRSYNPAISFQDSSGPWTIHGESFTATQVRLGSTQGSPGAAVSHWILIASEEIPDLLDHEEARMEFNIRYTRVPDNYPYPSYGNFGDARVVGCMSTPPSNGTTPIDFDLSGPDTNNWREGFHYDWPTNPNFPAGNVIYNIYGTPTSYDNSLGKIYWYAPLTTYTRYSAWSFYDSHSTLEGYSDGRRYVGIAFARNQGSNDDSYHDIAYDDIAVIVY